MSETPTMGPATPFFIVTDLKASVAFYRDGLGFEVRHEAPEDEPFFAMVGRESTQIMLKAIAPEITPQPNPTRHEWASWDAFIFAADPDALATEFEGRGTALHKAVADTDDGLRGFEVKDPDGYVFFFGTPR